MRVALFFRENSYGGSVRVSRFIYDILIERGFEVVPVANAQTNVNDGYFNGIEYESITIPRFNRDWFFFQRAKYFKQILLKLNADIVITTINLSHPMLVIAAKNLGKKVIISEHGNYTNIKGIKKRLLRYLSYKKADIVTLLTKFDKEYFKSFKNTVLIRNPMTIPSLSQNIKKENIILFPSRLDDNKRFSFLLKAFAMIDKDIRKDYKIVVCGDGKHREGSIKFAKQNGISLEITGFISNINEYYEKSKILALTSISEGLPNILIEAIFFRCARIAVDCISGPNELITDGFDGFLSGVNNVSEFSKKLETLMVNKEGIVERFCENALLRRAEFEPDNIQKSWLEVIKRVM